MIEQKIRAAAWRFIPTSVIQIGKLFLHRRSFLRETGVLRSFWTHSPQSKSKKPLPWMTYSAIRLLEDRLPASTSVLEWGAGASTLFFQDRVQQVVSVEHNGEWFEQLGSQVGAAVTLKFAPTKDEYIRPKFEEQEVSQFDLIVVDGIHRIECLEQAENLVSPRGVILLDDSTRSEYDPARTRLSGLGYKELCLYGLRPASSYFEGTSFFYRDNNIFGL